MKAASVIMLNERSSFLQFIEAVLNSSLAQSSVVSVGRSIGPCFLIKLCSQCNDLQSKEKTWQLDVFYADWELTVGVNHLSSSDFTESLLSRRLNSLLERRLQKFYLNESTMKLVFSGDAVLEIRSTIGGEDRYDNWFLSHIGEWLLGCDSTGEFFFESGSP